MKAPGFSAFVVLACLQFACQSYVAPQPNSAVDFETISAIIESKTLQFTEAHVTGDQAFLDSIFTHDARVYAPNMDVVAGRSEISEINAEYLSYGISQFREQSTSRYGSGDFVVDEGTYMMEYGPENTVEEGHYLNVWKRVGDDWKIEANMWTTIPASPDSE